MTEPAAASEPAPTPGSLPPTSASRGTTTVLPIGRGVTPGTARRRPGGGGHVASPAFAPPVTLADARPQQPADDGVVVSVASIPGLAGWTPLDRVSSRHAIPDDVRSAARDGEAEAAAALVDVEALRRLTLPALQRVGAELGIDDADTLTRQALTFAVEQRLLDADTALRATGVLEILPEGYGFLRSQDWNYLYGPDDIYVSPSQIKRFDLRTGDTVLGQVRPPREWERYLALLKVASINGGDPDKAKQRVAFDNLRPKYPDERIRLEHPGCSLSMRVFDLVAPVGKGQRGLIVAPPRAGKTILMQQMANSISENYPDIALIVLLIDERPEEVTDMRLNARGAEVVSSTFDEPAERHVQVADMVLEKAKRMVEHGRDVVILLDSITRLARAHNTIMPQSGRILSGGIDANAMAKPKRFFGAARNVDGGGSLTIIATALVETGSRMDEVIFEEFKGTGNLELVLDRKIADKRIFPAIDIGRSGTRREDLLLDELELNRVLLLRSFLGDMPSDEAITFLLRHMAPTKSNREFFVAMAQGG